MFSDMFDLFSDFATVDIRIYESIATFTASTGKLLTRYSFDEILTAHGYQKSQMQNYVRDKVFDDVEMIFVTDTLPAKDSYIYHNSIWYSIAYPDNAGYEGEIYIVGAKRIDKPALAFYVVGDSTGIVGDSTGVVGWGTYGV